LPSTKVRKFANVPSPEPFILKDFHKFLAIGILALKLFLKALSFR